MKRHVIATIARKMRANGRENYWVKEFIQTFREYWKV